MAPSKTAVVPSDDKKIEKLTSVRLRRIKFEHNRMFYDLFLNGSGPEIYIFFCERHHLLSNLIAKTASAGPGVSVHIQGSWNFMELS